MPLVAQAARQPAKPLRFVIEDGKSKALGRLFLAAFLGDLARDDGSKVGDELAGALESHGFVLCPFLNSTSLLRSRVLGRGIPAAEVQPRDVRDFGRIDQHI